MSEPVAGVLSDEGRSARSLMEDKGIVEYLVR